jgi:hypothetical protein
MHKVFRSDLVPFGDWIGLATYQSPDYHATACICETAQDLRPHFRELRLAGVFILAARLLLGVERVVPEFRANEPANASDALVIVDVVGSELLEELAGNRISHWMLFVSAMFYFIRSGMLEAGGAARWHSFSASAKPFSIQPGPLVPVADVVRIAAIGEERLRKDVQTATYPMAAVAVAAPVALPGGMPMSLRAVADTQPTLQRSSKPRMHGLYASPVTGVGGSFGEA